MGTRRLRRGGRAGLPGRRPRRVRLEALLHRLLSHVAQRRQQHADEQREMPITTSSSTRVNAMRRHEGKRVGNMAGLDGRVSGGRVEQWPD